MRVREGVSDELIKQALDNNGNGSSRNTAYFGEEEAYADWNYTYNPVGKSIITYPNQGNNYTAEFKIVVNPDGVTMNNGEKFEVVDTLKNLQYIYDSVAVKIGDDIHADYETTLGEDDDGNDTLTWIVPDKTRIEITYKAKVQGTGSVTYSNTVSILDKYKSETGDQQVSVEYGGSGSGSSYSLKIVKVDANDPNKRLEGAVFELLTYYNGTSNNDPAKSEPVKLKDSTGNDLNIFFGETDKNGEVTVESNQEKNGWALWPGRLYCLHEVTAPEGYKAGGNYLFYIPTGNQGENIPQNCTLVGGNGEQILIENEESETETTSVTFSGTKTIEGIESTDKVFSFSLYETGKDYEIADDEAAKEIISTKGTITGKQTISFSPIEYDSTGDYYYVIRENTLDEPDGFSIDETEYKIKVTVSEDQNGNLTANVEGVTSPDKIDFTNYYAGETSIKVTKVWKDGDNQDSKRPENIQVQLYADGKAQGKPVVLNAQNQWSHIWSGLDEKSEGKTIEYTVKEVGETDGKIDFNGAEYQVTYAGDATTGYTITNSYTPETTKVSGSKTWDDANNQDGKRPESIKINLLANGKKADEKTVSADDNWSWSFTNLPKYENGRKITYTITEDAVPDYTIEIDGYDVTNSYTPGKTSVTVTKSWNDTDNQDGKRPENIQVQLYADGKAQGEPVVLNAGNYWSHTWSELDEKSAGNRIKYTVKEVGETGGKIDFNGAEYQVTYAGDATTGYTITNAYASETTEVSGSKTWDDNNDQDGRRPESITINLFANGEKVDEKTVSADDNWSWSFINLPKYENGAEIIYTITEDRVPNYTTAVNDYDVTNTYTPGKTSISVIKRWNDANDQDGKRPESIQVQLYADGEKQGEPVVLNDKNYWSHTWSELDEKSAGNRIKYTVKEVGETGGKIDFNGAEYQVTYAGDATTGYTITNAYASETTEVSGSKTWDDNNDQDGRRPESITINLFANGEKVDEKTVSADDNWSWSFINLPKYENGAEIIYTITEDRVPNYTTAVNDYDVTNTYTPGKTSISVIKRWNDANDQDGKRPDSIQVQLYADGEKQGEPVVLNVENRWSHTWSELDEKSAGNAIKYTVKEVGETDGKIDFDGVEYQVTYSGDAETGYTITNSYTPEKTKIPVTKKWKDNNDQDGIRPNTITVNLLANGKDTGESLTLNEANNWSGSFTNLAKYKDGVEISYTVEEVSVEGYETVITGNMTAGYVITNSHTSETTEVSGSKTWDDANNQDGKRPASIKINLLANGEKVDEKTVSADDNWSWSFKDLTKYENGKEITYTITEDAVPNYTTAIDGYDVINSYTPGKTSVTVTKSWDDAGNQDGKRPDSIQVQLYADGEELGEPVVLNAETRWSHTWSDLDEKADGKTIEYSVKEVGETDGKIDFDGAEYQVTYTGNATAGYTITNSYTSETTEVSGSKTWDDANNQDGKRPESIKINLLANGEKADEKTVGADDNWSWNFTDLPKYENGTEISYTITEDQVDGYSTIYNEYDVINSYTPGKTSVTVTKNWQDSNDQDGIRPNEITVKLLANGKDTGKTLTLNETNNWEGSFTELAEHENGEVIEYTVEEVSVEGYETVITGNMTEGYVITNSHTSETTEVSGSKTWDDEDDQDGKRPDSITIRLLANGTEVAEKAVSADDNWSWSFTNLPKYENGTEIIYTITEDAVPDYTTEINGYDVTNTYKPGKTSVSVTKSWEDAGDRDGKRPESIQVQLYADGKTQGEPVVLNAENKWSHTWSELDEKSEGNIIEYTVKEVGENDGNIDFDGAEYQVAYTGDAATGYEITNSYNTEMVEVSGSKTWEDKGNEGARPDSITIRLYADNEEITEAEVTAENGWSWSFENLPKYRDGGQEIIYTISEDAVDNYITEVDGYDVTNKYQPGKTSISVAKRWNDSENRDGKRPDSVRVQLYADGEAVGDPVVLNKSNDWRYTWSELDKQADGKEILYTVKEVGEEKGTIDFDGTEYKVTYTGNAEKGYTITNSYNAVSVGVQTGDNTNMASNLAVMFAAMAAAGAVMIFRRRRYNEK